MSTQLAFRLMQTTGIFTVVFFLAFAAVDALSNNRSATRVLGFAALSHAAAFVTFQLVLIWS